jgi:uncharacterized surface protein with fasciclin (FAS1) repeats
MNRRFALKTAAVFGLVALTAGCTDMMMTASEPDIVDVAAANDDFSTLVAAVTAAGLVDTLKGDGPFTVFAPTNAAFDALPAGTVESLLEPGNIETLQAILTYHVVPGNVTSDQLAGQRLNVATVNGANVHIDGTDGVTVNNATVTAADIEASNGVIHVIDTVLLPPGH